MKITVTVDKPSDLVYLTGHNATDLGKHLGISESYISMKLSGQRPWYKDEVKKFYRWLRRYGVEIRFDQVQKMLGGNIKNSLSLKAKREGAA